ncbi:hypothetical protein ES319_A07G128300v1 [Gossypium barbadense]|uniref:Uncharacterized protein n=3 Tax=Gossypium TaxID=3633 RepID=A0A5J5V3C9_GOSBA|nr:hypothetical protein ES319_A07G128300v1 [Gossypium barbadense]KAB2074074.1 hypothetical protein ES319_A07G128300v1 [Gossypium barbadense]TYH09935.1 hypothetical protein ES288_A07G137200v1 [Gossypium darwinii]TYI19050.1 hypothetical protein ES332_A07G137100v1 [Gossypium tomentosum]
MKPNSRSSSLTLKTPKPLSFLPPFLSPLFQISHLRQLLQTPFLRPPIEPNDPFALPSKQNLAHLRSGHHLPKPPLVIQDPTPNDYAETCKSLRSKRQRYMLI